MGLLSLGTPLPWNEVVKHADYIREHGIIQLLHTISKYKDRSSDAPLWGDEVEYMVVRLKNGRASLVLNQEKILGQLMNIPVSENVSYHPEFGRYMVEATPGKPFGPDIRAVLDLEPNLKLRRRIAAAYLEDDEHLLAIGGYPLMGVGSFAETKQEPGGPASKSLFLPDDIINLHPRFPTLAANIRRRRGKKVEISVPVFKDSETEVPWSDPLCSNRPDGLEANSVYMDAMGFGMGCSCLQLTFQGSDIDQARDLYDALAPLTPLMLALSAATPIFRGILSDQDVRWSVISEAVDDRTDEEKTRIPKSRYDSIDCYISRKNSILNADTDFYNDLNVVTNPKVSHQLESSGLFDNDPLLVQHFSHLFIRDPLVIFKELIEQDDSVSTDHFENIQSTNWQTMRFKPPPNDSIGWRVEFRPMEIQITDFENAAYSIFIVLMARVAIEQNRCFYQPISQIDRNMKTAHLRDSVNSGRFWFRTNTSNQTANSDPRFQWLTLDEILNGCPTFEGLLSMVRSYLSTCQLSQDEVRKINSYLNLIERRASGELKTDAQWIRDQVRSHRDYKFNSIITESINFDLMKNISKIGEDQDWIRLVSQLSCQHD